jgi:glycine oxidase
MSQPDVVIVGGGVIGLSVAYVLAREGVSTTVLDRGELGRAASWAGAGLISPGGERPPSNPLVALRVRSAELFPRWADALREATGIDTGYRRSGGVDVAWTAEEDQALRTAAGRWREEGIAYERLEPREFQRVEPALNPDVRVAYFLPDRAQVRNPWHLRALIAALKQDGARLCPGLAAEGFEVREGVVSGVRTAEGVVRGDRFVVAAGPWSEAILGTIGVRVATPPVKGQIVLLRGDRPILRRIVEHGKNYLVPRDDGHVLVGATEEDAGFDTRTTSSAVRDLIDEALRLCPALAHVEVERAWAGLRPGSFDSRPFLGIAPGYSNLIVATGHRRAGLQLSPGTAEVVADLVLERPPRIDLAPFRLDRPPAWGDETAFRS